MYVSKCVYTIAELKKRNAEAGYTWFSKANMRGFNTRIAPGIMHKGDFINLFITSERCDWNTPRLYTIRQLCANGSIRNIGAAMSYTSLDSARRAIRSGRAFVGILPESEV